MVKANKEGYDCLTCDHKMRGSIPCQAKATLLIRSNIALLATFRPQLRKKSKSQAEFITSNKLRCYVQINSVATPNFK